MSLTESSRLHAVVEREEGLAEARGAAHVRLDHGDAELLEVVVGAAQEAELGVWPSGPPWMSISTGRLPGKRAGGQC